MFKTILSAAAAVALIATSTGTASASSQKKYAVYHPTVGHTKVIHQPVLHSHAVYNYHKAPLAAYHNWHVNHGVRFSYGYYFPGREYRYFQYRHWNPTYRCWTFFYPDMNCYYYWSGSNGCFYPISYAPVVAPNGMVPEAIDSLPPDTLPPDSMSQDN